MSYSSEYYEALRKKRKELGELDKSASNQQIVYPNANSVYNKTSKEAERKIVSALLPDDFWDSVPDIVTRAKNGAEAKRTADLILETVTKAKREAEEDEDIAPLTNVSSLHSGLLRDIDSDITEEELLAGMTYAERRNYERTKQKVASGTYVEPEPAKDGLRMTGDAILSGLASWNKGWSTTADVLLGKPIQALGWENNPISKVADYYDDQQKYYDESRHDYIEARGYKAGASDFFTNVFAAVPDALLAIMTGGASKAATTASLTKNAVGQAGNYLTRAGLTVEGMARNPQFWSSFVRTFGTDYEEAQKELANKRVAKAINDEEVSKGEKLWDDAKATLAATFTSLVNAGIEIGPSGKSGIQGLPSELMEEGGSALTKWAVSSLEEGGEEVLQGFVSDLVAKSMYDDDREILDLKKMGTEFFMGAGVGAVLGGSQIGIQSGIDSVDSAIQNHEANKLTEDEQTVFDKIVNDGIAEAEADGTKLSKSEKKEIEKLARLALEKGYISTDTIEEIFDSEGYGNIKVENEKFYGSDTYKSYIDTVKSESKQIEELENQLKELENEPNTIGNSKKYDAIQSRLEDLKNSTKSAELKSQVDQELKRISEMHNQLRDSVFDRVKDTRLAESFHEFARSKQAFTADLSKYDEKQRKVIESAINSKVLNNSRVTHEFVDWIARVSADTGAIFDFTNNKRLKESGFAMDGVVRNGFVNTKTGEITLNVQSAKALNTVVGHEITHVLEGTEFYDALQSAVIEYAKSKGEYQSRLDSITALYKKYDPDADPVKELTADLVGDYLFTDTEFINNLSTNHRNVFQKIYDEIKYLSKVATAGSDQARKLEKLKKAFADAYRADSKAQTNSKIQNSISETTDGRSVAVVDNDILSNIDTSTWNKTIKKQAQKAASNELKKFADGFTINGIEFVGNKDTRDEYTRSDYTDILSHDNSTAFLDKMRAAAVIDDVIQVATDWKNDHELKHDREDYVDFVRGNTLIKSGDSTYRAVVLAGITSDGKSIFYDVVDIYPESFEVKKSESHTAVSANELPNAILRDSDADTVAQENPVVKEQFSLSDSDGNQLTQEQAEYFKDSKARDRNGNLLKVYHTTNSDFTVFDKSKKGETTGDANTYLGFFFADEPEYMAQFPEFKNGKTEAYYLNMTNPIDMNNISRQAFIDIVEATGGDVQEAAELYDSEYADELKRAKFRGDNSPIMDMSRLLEELTGDYFDYAEFYNALKPNYDQLMSKGYDGIINSLDGRGWANEYIVLDSNQAKLASNTNPSTDPDIRFSLSAETDKAYMDAVNRGDTETAQQMVLDIGRKAGHIVRAYHGTARGDRVGNVFLPERATSGPMAFFTDNKEIAENYSKSKQDTSMAYDPDFDRYETQFRIKTKYQDMPLYRAWGYLPFDARRRITEKAGQLRENWDGDNELILDPETNEANGGFQWQLKEARGNAIQALTEQWLNSGTLFNEEGRFLDVLEMAGVTEEFKKIGMDSLYFKDPDAKHEKVYDALLKITNPFETSSVDEQFIADLESWYDEQDQSQYVRESMESDLWDKNSIDAYDFVKRLRSDLESNTTHAWTSIPDSVTDYLKSLGYDGIKDTGGKFTGDIHTVWIPFSSEQIKSAEPVTYDDKGNVIPLSERFNPDKKDIRYSLSNIGETQNPTGRYNVYGKDIALPSAMEDIAPIAEESSVTEQTISKTETVAEDAPVAISKMETTTEELLPDAPIEQEIENLSIQIAELDDRLAEKITVGQYDAEFESIVREMEALHNQLDALEREASEADMDRLSSLDDADAPPEAAPFYTEQSDIIPITKKLENDIARDVRSALALSNKHMADVHSIIQEYSNSEFPSRDQLFHELRDKFGTYTESFGDDSIVEAKKYLRTYGLQVGDYIQSEIADYATLKKQNRYKIKFSDDGTPVDVLYAELNGMYPHLFPESIDVPTDQFMQMVEVANMDNALLSEQEIPDEAIMEVADTIIHSVSQYRQVQKEKAATKYGREAFGSLMKDADKHIPQFSQEAYRRLSERPKVVESEVINAPIAEVKSDGQQAFILNDQELSEREVKVNKALQRIERNLNFDKSELSREYRQKKLELQRSGEGDIDSKLEALDQEYQWELKKLEANAEVKRNQAKTAVQRSVVSEKKTAFWENLLGDTSTWKDMPLGLMYKTKTLKRILRSVVRDANGKPNIKLADEIYKATETKYDHNQALLKRESNKLKDPFVKLGLNHTEYVYAHMLGEFRHNPDTDLTEAVVKDYLNKHKKKIDTAKVDTAIGDARKLFDDLFERVNTALREQGFKEIPYRKGYFPHFSNPKQNWFQKLMNWKPVDNEIPTSIAGLTQQFKPQRSWQAFDKQRKSDITEYGLDQALDTYIHGALDWIYHIDDLQDRRSLENYLRYIHSDEGIKARIDEIKADESLDAEDAQRMIDGIYAEARNPLGNLVRELMNRTNTLANKKSSMDREMEDDLNRKVYSTMTNINRRINANMVVGSLRSALTNFIPIVQSWHMVSPWYTVGGLGDYVISTIRDDGMVAKSDFLTNRLIEEEKLYQTGWDKTTDAVAFVGNLVDSITSQTVWRSKYLQNLHDGMSEVEAISDADQYAKDLIAGRSRGNQPTIFEAKNPATKLLTAFQLEVANQYGHMFEDVPIDSKNKARLVKGYATAMVGAYVYNALFSALTGSDTAFDPIGIIEDFLRDLGMFGDDDEEEDKAQAFVNLGKNIVQEVPFVGGYFGGGRVPISSALPYGNDSAPMQSLLADVERGWNDGNFTEGDWTGLVKEMLKPLYYVAMPVGGGQLKKTVEGLGMFLGDHPIAGSYTDSGDLRYPVDPTVGNVVQAGLFGQYASKTARAYFDQGRKPLDEKQTQEFVDVKMPIQDYWNYRDGLKGLDKISEQADYINSLDIPTWKKNLLINNLADREKPIDMTDYGMYGSFEEFDFAEKNPEKYSFFKNNGISYTDYASADEDLKRTYTWAYDNPEKYQFIKDNGVTIEDYSRFNDEQKDAYTWAYNNPEKFTLSKAVTGDLFEYRKFTGDLYDIRGDKDANGKTISGSSKAKKTDYINGLPLDYGQKIILYRSLYDSNADKAAYNADIVDYLNSRDDISYEEMVTILTELDMKVDAEGNVTW